MWKWKGKKRAEEGGDGESGGAPPSKRPALDSSSEDDIVVCELAKNRRLTVRKWQGKLWVDIREFYEKDGKSLPGKKGISLPLDQWKILREHMDKIDEVVNEKT
ncbi:hypothetical protein LUZ60_004266 [Juncus effusus]|nr:hypothetical protein LUZ60_004266 [Juncus effusus]